MANAKSKPIDASTLTDEQLEALLAQRKADAAIAAAKVEEERVAALKLSFESLNATFDAAEAELEAFEAGLSVADRALLGIKVQADRSPKGATLAALRAHVTSLAPGSRFTTAHLLEAVVPGTSAATVRSALGQLGIEPIGKGKGAHYVIAPSVGVPEEDTSGTNKPTDEEPPAEPTGGVGYASFPAQS